MTTLKVYPHERLNTNPFSLRDHAGFSFSVVAIHSDHYGDSLVNQVFSWLHQCFQPDCKTSFHSWTFEKLSAALDTRALSIRIGGSADMIIIAASATESLPDHINRWLDSTMSQPREQTALILAMPTGIGSSSAEASPVFSSLQSCSTRWQSKLICCPDIQHQSSRHSILRHINQRLQSFPVSDRDQFDLHSSVKDSPSNKPDPGENQFNLTPFQFQAVRLEAYHLWLQAGSPVGKEIDFWLAAEKQVVGIDTS